MRLAYVNTQRRNLNGRAVDPPHARSAPASPMHARATMRAHTYALRSRIASSGACSDARRARTHVIMVLSWPRACAHAHASEPASMRACACTRESKHVRNRERVVCGVARHAPHHSACGTMRRCAHMRRHACASGDRCGMRERACMAVRPVFMCAWDAGAMTRGDGMATRKVTTCAYSAARSRTSIIKAAQKRRARQNKVGSVRAWAYTSRWGLQRLALRLPR